jgi:tRNA modification GTPase
MDTIFAQASARGKAGVAVIRVSGALAHEACRALAGRVPPPRQATLCRLTDAEGGYLDEALVLVFSEGASFTGEPSVEFHTHGGRATIEAVLSHLADTPGLRLAEPGEFTRRALINGRMDLTQVEALGDLIEAETEVQRKLALRTFGGEISQKVELWRGKLLRALALIEATIDFADEEVPQDVGPEVAELLDALRADLSRDLAGARVAERVRDGFEVAIVGRPNVGKSTLLNALAGRQAALTSEIAGTTRDVIEVRMDIHGLAVTLLDTAGLRETSDVLEAAGVRLAEERARQADLRLFLLDSPTDDPAFQPEAEDIVALGKADLHPGADNALSGQTGQGVDWVLSEIGDRLSQRVAGASSVSHLRQRKALETARDAVEAAQRLLESGTGDELAAEELRRAAHALEFLLGRVDVEQVLGEIFSSFCIGK